MGRIGPSARRADPATNPANSAEIPVMLDQQCYIRLRRAMHMQREAGHADLQLALNRQQRSAQVLQLLVLLLRRAVYIILLPFREMIHLMTVSC